MIYNIAIAILLLISLINNYLKNKEIQRIRDNLDQLNNEYAVLYNQKAQQIALNDNTRKYNETLVKIGFQNEDMAMQ